MRWSETATKIHEGPTTIEALWRADFEFHEGQHAKVTTSGMWKLAPVVEAGLRTSLPQFQLGEMGTGAHLLTAAEKVGDPDYVQALQLFVREEQEHARLLALVCQDLEIEMLQKHWTDGVFQVTRTIAGLRAEVLMLLVAEIVAVRYYKVLAEGVGDHVLSRIFARIQEDEVRHLEFHEATLPQHIDRWPKPLWLAARTIWLIALVGTSAVVAWDHRKVLRACDSGPTRFFREMLRLIRVQLPKFFRPTTA
ncbi:MAG: ferritin-like domain-containing protein [Acidimicrobiales bacterium]|nr:ferritin-like domain-containing protein [Acidimicrobiales bacterium]RZV41021.1 MAG: ferritin-like domain-containing protein [Acidimicrobiales bacterium]